MSLNLESGALLFEAEKDKCELEAPLGEETSACLNEERASPQVMAAQRESLQSQPVSGVAAALSFPSLQLL